ncbi:hypothetical protein GQ600_18423 [Phytophthora cactorum]|nr:hypothetical protein GQ600_18423 [Phytophthora cactorum]
MKHRRCCESHRGLFLRLGVGQIGARWHGSFRTTEAQEFAYELELPDRSGYRFYPWCMCLD